jgi:hypothetical protein
MCGCNAASVVDEVATFALGGALAGAGASSAQVWLSSYPVHGYFGESDANRSWASFARQPSVSLLGGSFSLQLSPGDLVTVSTLAGASTPFRGCASNDCASEPPPPTAQGAGSLSFVQLEGAPTAAPGRFMTDVSGAFEIAVDPSRPATTVLAQVASGRPVGAPYDGSRPHSITGDLDTTDADVAADVLLAQADGSAALLGAHVFTFHSATPSTLDAAPGIWLRVARHDAQTLSWALLSGLDDARLPCARKRGRPAARRAARRRELAAAAARCARKQVRWLREHRRRRLAAALQRGRRRLGAARGLLWCRHRQLHAQ